MGKKFMCRLVHGGILLAVIAMISGCGTGPDNPPGGDSQFAFGEQPVSVYYLSLSAPLLHYIEQSPCSWDFFRPAGNGSPACSLPGNPEIQRCSMETSVLLYN